MRIKNSIMVAFGLVFVGLSLFGGEICFANSPPFKALVQLKLMPVSRLKPGQPADLRLTYTVPAEYRCAEAMNLVVSTESELQYLGSPSFTAKIPESDTFSTTLKIVLPATDTAFLTIRMMCGNLGLPYTFSFVVDEDSVKLLEGDARRFLARPDPNRKLVHGGGYVVPGQFPDLDSLIAADSTYMRTHNLKYEPVPDFVYDPTKSPNQSRSPESDSVTLDSLRQAKERESREEMQRKEREVLLSSEVERILIADTVYTRVRGQRKFRPTMTATEVDELIQKANDSLQSLPDDALIELLVDAPDSAALKRLDAVTSNRTATAIPGTYRVWIPKGQVNKIRDLELRYELMMFRLYGPPDSLESIGLLDNSNVGKVASSQFVAQDVIWSEDFAGVWPGSWEVRDDQPLFGIDYWWPLLFSTRSGAPDSYSCWCSGFMDESGGTHYDNMMGAKMSRDYIDVHKYRDLRLTFWLKYDMEGGDSFLARYGEDTSLAGIVDNRLWTGTSNGWVFVDDSVVFPSQQDLFLSFEFSSDNVGWDKGRVARLSGGMSNM